MFGKRKDEVFKALKALLEPFGISRYYTDDWGAYQRHLETDKHEVGKRNTQKIERKNLNFRTWIKRLTRKTICFSKSETLHDTVIGLLINKVEFGLDIHAKLQIYPTIQNLIYKILTFDTEGNLLKALDQRATEIYLKSFTEDILRLNEVSKSPLLSFY